MSKFQDLSIEQREALRQHYAQIQALRWLQGRVSDQMVKAFFQVHIEQLDRIGYPISASGDAIDVPTNLGES